MIDINEVVPSSEALFGRVIRDGYVFRNSKDSPLGVYDTIVLINPDDFIGYTKSSHTLREQIDLVNSLKIKKAITMSSDISFITECPSLTNIMVTPYVLEGNEFDFSPLYSMPNLKTAQMFI